MANLDEILSKFGLFGRYQIRHLICVGLPGMFAAMTIVSLVFTLHAPEHRCQVKNWTTEQFYSESPDIVNVTFVAKQCFIEVRGWKAQDNGSYVKFAKQKRCDAWHYSTDAFYRTLTSQKNYVCDESMKPAHIHMVFFVGVFVGDILFGQLSDRFGRKKICLVALTIMSVSKCVTAWISDYYLFAAMQFIVGCSCRGTLLLSFVFVFEYSSYSGRSLNGLWYNLFFAVGLCILSGIGAILKDWQYILLASTVPCFFLIPGVWLSYESPRWLLNNGRDVEAVRILKNIAKINKITIPNSWLSSITVQTTSKFNVLKLFKSRVMGLRTSIFVLNWFALGLGYYAVLMHAGDLGVNFYLSQFIMAVIEIPILFFILFPIKRWGRRITYIILTLVGGVACVCSLFPVTFGKSELKPIIFVLAFIGKLGISGSFGVIYIYTGEIFPTECRNGGFGLSSSGARVGSILAPYVAISADLIGGKFGTAFPLIIIGTLCIIASALCLYVPETVDKQLPDTIEEAEHLQKFDEEKQMKENEEHTLSETLTNVKSSFETC